MTEEKKDDEIEIDFGKIFGFLKGKEKGPGEAKHEAAKSDGEELNIDLGAAADFFRKHKTLLVYSLLIILLLMTFYSRTQNIPNLEGKYLISPDDPYVFLRYANDIAEDGKLTANDTLRYYPDGVDAAHERLGSAYIAGYALIAARAFSPELTMYDIAAYFAPVLLVIGIAGFFFLTREILEDEWAALVASGLLAFSAAIFFRTTAGFLEKEPLFLPFMVLGMLFFLRAYKQKELKKWTYVNAALAGVFTGLAGFTSGLFQFVSIYLSAFFLLEVLLQKISKQKMVVFGTWIVATVIVLLLVKESSDPIGYLSNFMHPLLPIAALFFGIVAIYVKKPKQLEWLPYGLFHVLVGLGIVLLLASAISVFQPSFLTDKIDFAVQRISTPIGIGRFEQSVSENQPPVFLGGGSSWWNTFGVSFINPFGGFFSIGLVFLLFYFGGIVIFYREFRNFRYAKWLTAIFAIFISALIFEHFSADQRYQWVNAIFGAQAIYFAIFGAAIVAFLFLEHRKHEHLEKVNSAFLLILIWFAIATIVANGAVRHFFMLSFPAMMMAAYFIKWGSEWLGARINVGLKPATYLFAAIVIVMSFWVISLSNANMYPGLQNYYSALDWVRENTPEDSVFTHWWDYGYIMQAVGQRATVVDPGNFFVQRNYDTGGYLFNAFNNQEALTYLDKYGRPDYWFIISEDIPKFFQISRLGSLSNLTGMFELPPEETEETLGREAYFTTYAVLSQQSIVPNNLGVYSEYPTVVVLDSLGGQTQVLQDFRIGNTLYSGENTFVLRYMVPVSNNGTGPILAQVFNSLTQRTDIFKVQCVCEKQVGCSDVEEDEVPAVPTCVLPFYDQNSNAPYGLLNIPYKTKDVLFTHLYILEKDIPGYELVHTSGAPLDLLAMAGRTSNIMIYQFNYEELEANEGW
jgi:asparagine N-glycosylation enzyme membrane subunit Stt3